jgi:nitrogen regulatory protein PII
MKQIMVMVKPFVAEAVLEAVARFDVSACIVDEVKGYGRQKSYLDQYQGSEYNTAYLPKVEISVWIHDDQADALAAAIVAAARTGRMGDGKILVLDTAWPEALEF